MTSSPVRRPLWKRLLFLVLKIVGGGVATLVLLGLVVWWLQATGRLVPLIIRFQAATAGRQGDPFERPWPDPGLAGRKRPALRRDAAGLDSGAALYRPDQVWEMRLAFTSTQWEAMQPRSVPAKADFGRRDGKIPLMNTNASRNGLLGAVGLDLDWTTASAEFGGIAIPDVSVRFKGNGTFLGAMGGVKKPLKVDLSKSAVKAVGGVSVLNFGNLSGDFSCLSDTLAYEFFREAGVPAPRTTFAHVTVSVADRWTNRPHGLHVMVENVDGNFLRARPGMERFVLFKPVTYELFRHLGDEWAAYHRIYDAKHGLDDAAKARVMATARFVTESDDTTFAAKVGEHFDLDEVARFVAVNSLISSYDGFLNNGQNFHMYLDPATGRFGFIPWDLDRAWGEFPFIGTREDKERASITRPWVADNRLLGRLFGVESFRTLYRTRLEEIFRKLWDPKRLSARVDALAPVVREALVDDSGLRLAKFEEAVTDRFRDGSVPAIGGGGPDMSPNREAHQLKRFFVRRHASVEAQLAGREEGVVFTSRRMPGP